MRVFVTGASGFIGSHVTRALLEKGHEVAVLAKPADPLSRLQAVCKQVKILPGRLADTDRWKQAVAEFQPQACIHLAWYAEPGKYLQAPENIRLLTWSLSLFKELIDAGCRRIVAAGTCFEYDLAFGYLNEETPVRPESLYAAAKLSCYLMGRQIAAQAESSLAWGRIFYPYGPQEDQRRLVPAAIAAFRQGAPFPATLGEQIRDYIQVADVAEAFCVLMERQASGVFNISSGIPVSIRQLLTTIGSLMGCEHLIEFGARPYREWEPPFICGNNQRLRSLGWKPVHSLSTGLSATIFREPEAKCG